MIREKMKIGFINPGSLGTNHNEFLSALAHHDFDVLAINETWLRTGEEGRAPSPPGYYLRHLPRPPSVRSRGGGVGFYIRRSIAVNVLKHPDTSSVEQMWISIIVGRKKLVIGTAYRPPWLCVHTFISAITDSISTFSYHDVTILLGDFNINLNNVNEPNTVLLRNFFNYMSLTQYILKPTHFTDSSETLLDLICSDTDLCRVGVDHVPSLSAHSFVFCELDIPKSKSLVSSFQHRPLKNINLARLEHHISLVDWDYMLALPNVDDVVDVFNSTLLYIFDLFAPIKTTRVRQNYHPWITYDIRLMMRRRDAVYRQARKSKSEIHINSYKELKKLVYSSIQQKKSTYFETYVNSNIFRPRLLWKHIKNQVNFNNKNNDVLPANLLDPNIINAHFLNLPAPTNPPTEIEFYNLNRFKEACFSIQAVNEDTVVKMFNSLQSTAVGCDEISLDMLILLLPNLLHVYTAILNKSILSGVFPAPWRKALIRPISKNNNPLTPSDLRPISILPCFSKVLEKIVCTQLTDYLNLNEILPPLQSGFRKGRSTSTALAHVVDDILCAHDKGEGTILVLLDFSRAFDSINIQMLLSKLRYYGFDDNTVKWFEGYLTNRVQCVEIKNNDGSVKRSRWSSVNRGVPQGSILGPILFSLGSADITKCIVNCKYHIYADDVQLYLSFKPQNTESAVGLINEDLERIATWCKVNSLSINVEKTKFILFGSKHKIKSIEEARPLLKLNGQAVERVREVRNLGVVMDENLRFEKHTSNVVRQCFYRLKVLYRIRDSISTDVRIRLCESLVLSKFNYADVVTGPRLLVRTQKLIQRVQNACARYCFIIPYRAHVTPFLNASSILKMNYRRQLHFATLLFNLIKYKIPPYLYNKLRWTSEVNTSHLTRASLFMLSMPTHNTAAFRGSFRFNASKCWNDLPPPFRNLESLKSFKFKLKSILLNLQKQS